MKSHITAAFGKDSVYSIEAWDMYKNVSVAKCLIYPTTFVVQRSMFPDCVPDKVFLPLVPLPMDACHERR